MGLHSSTHDFKASKNMETGYSDRLGTVRTINKSIDRLQQSREFMTITNSDMQSGTLISPDQGRHKRNER